MNVIMVVVFLYFLMMIAIGIVFSRVKMDHSKFLLGGKTLPGWALGLSERATGASAWIMIGYTGFVFSTGLSAIWVSVGSAIGIITAWAFLAKRFIKVRDKYNALTIPGYLAGRFGKHSRLIQSLGGMLIIVFFMFYLGAQIAGAGKTFFTTFQIDLVTGMIICTIIVIAISFGGGFISVVWTDVIQGIMMLATLTIVPILALYQISTNDLSISVALTEAGPGFDSLTGGLTGFALGVLLFNNFAWLFGYLGGEPQLSARFMALKNERDAKIGLTTVVIWSVIVYFGTTIIGLSALTLYGAGSFSDPETILPFMIMELAPPWIAGLLLAGIIAAIVTTADSQLLVVVSSVSEDILHRGLGLNLSDKQLVNISRLTVIVGALVGLVVALTSNALVYVVTSWAWAGVACTLSAAIILAFFWNRYSSIGVISTILSGLIFTIIWISTPLDQIITARITTFFIAGFFGIVFSLLFPDINQDSNHTEKTQPTLNT
ncbi:sodium/proline symporter [Halalkalibacter krulwichiae]|nr:sodium/proline symporter [Halalkalibacter krulwichiae]